MNRWKFTIRSLLVFTVFVSIAMYFAVTWTVLFLIAGYWLTYAFAMFGAFRVTAQKCSRGASLVWLLCGAVLVFIAATNLYLIPVGGMRRASTAEVIARKAVSLVLADIGLVGIVRSWIAFSIVKQAEATQRDSINDA
jgi:hypothetical protein